MTVTTYSVNRRAELTVSDEGPGIPQRVQSRIFERFYTADTAGGSGLGLAIARELAQRMDGRIAITSSRRFTAFTLDLPPAAPAAPAQPPPARRQGARVRARAALAAALLLLAWRLLAGCGGGGDGDGGSAATGGGRAPKPAPQVIVETAADGFDAAEVYREAAPGVVTIRSIFGAAAPPRAPASSSTPTARSSPTPTSSPTNRAARRKPAKEVFVEFPDRNVVPAEDRRLRPLRRRRPARSRARRLRPAPAGARRRPRPRRRPAGGGDRQPLRRAAVALGRRRLGHRPLGQIADPVPDRGRDPDRRLDQPRQLGRPAARRRRPRGRHQPADRDQLRRQRRGRLRGPDLGDQALGRPARGGRQRRIRLHRRLQPGALPAARREARPRHRPTAACSPKSSPAARPTKAGLEGRRRETPLPGRPNTAPAAT